MPELPEVETVKKTLDQLVKHKTVESVEVYYEKVLKNISVSEFEQKLINQTFNDFRRIGKYLIFDLDNYSLVSHLRMEGKYNYSESYEEKNKHDIFKISFTDGSQLVFNDVRKFGTMEFVSLNDEHSLKSVDKLGPEPFSEQFNVDYLHSKILKRTAPVKSFLLDQSVVTGLGNIYVDEVLFCSKIHPLTPINKLNDDELLEIISCSRKVLQKAIDEGGTTIKSFSVTGDVHGKFQHELNVYGRKDEECFRCNHKISKIKVGGRGTHFCEVCQVKK